MPRLRRHRLLRAALVGIGALGGCAISGGPAPRHEYARHLRIDAELAAALVAGAMRAELPFADPVPQAAGAPAEPMAAGEFSIRYEQRDDGTWLPHASQRLCIAMPRTAQGELHPHVDHFAAAGMPGFGSDAGTIVEVRVQATTNGCTVTAMLPTLADHDFTRALDRTWMLLADADPAASVPNEHNLVAFAAHRLLVARARRELSGDQAGTELLTMQAVRLGAVAPALDLDLAARRLQNGEREEATRCYWSAALRTDDPTLRQQAMRQAMAAERGRGDGRSLREEVMTELLADHLDRAAALLHTAHREDPRPIGDYALLRELHHRNRDPESTLACSLLDREYAAGETGENVTADLVKAGFGDLVRRLAAATLDTATPAVLPSALMPAPRIAAAPLR